MIDALSSRRQVIVSLPLSFLLLAAQGPIASAQIGRPIIPDAQAEGEALIKSATSLKNYLAEYDRVNLKTKPATLEVNQLNQQMKVTQASSTSLKKNLETLIQKAKSSGAWENLDVLFLKEFEQVQAPAEDKASFLSLVKQLGGAKAALERGVQQVVNLPASLDQDMEAIKRKQSSFNFELISPAYAKIALWQCAVVAACGIAGVCGGCLACGVGAVIGMAANC